MDFCNDLEIIENYATAILDLIAEARATHDVPTTEGPKCT